MKNFKFIKSVLLSPFLVGLVITMIITSIAIDYYAHIDEDFTRDDRSLRSLIHQIHEKTIDWRMLSRGAARGSDRVAILAVDDESIRLEGRWPWPRDKVAKLIDRATLTYGAKLIAFDMTFSEPDNSSALPTLSRLTDKISDAPAKALINEELNKANVDKVLANSIDAARDQLILGAFSSNDGHFLPFQDICADAHFQRSYAGRYWSTELVKPVVIDRQLAQLKYPRQAVMANLTDYFGTLEGLRATTILSETPSMETRITASLASGGISMDPGNYPSLIVDDINNDYVSAQAHLASTPELANNEKIRSIFTHLQQALTEKEIATFRSSLFSASLDYCQRFFTAQDELRTIELMKKRYANLPPEFVESVFSANSWKSVWDQAPPESREPSELAIERIVKSTPPILIPEKSRWEVNIPEIDNAKSNSGYFDAVLDTDGTVRKNALLRRDGFSYLTSIAFKTFLVDQKLSAQAVVANEDVDNGRRYGRVFKSLEAIDSDGNSVLKIPVDKKGFLQVNYSGPQMSFPHISATDLLSDAPTMQILRHDPENRANVITAVTVNKKDFLKNKILILGATAIGVYDLRVTPFEENFPGVETHANALSNLLIETARARGEKVDPRAPGFLRRSASEESTMWIYLMVGGLILSALLTYFGSVVGLAIAIAFLAGIYYFDTYWLFRSGVVVTTLFPASLVVFNFIGLTSFKYFTEERKKRELKGTFEKYVSPSIVNEVLADPENIELGGKKMALTVMFSDVRGFTTISEKLDPRALSDLLNSYLTPMTNLVFANKGTLDKYMGDAIMAFWGAPVHFPDHAKHAARCALQMLEKLRELQSEYRAKGLPEIDIGIGLNTGEMSVGNMGSDTVRSYTVMGDAVNLGSRLEGINKQYGTRIIVSEFTFEEIKDQFVCREIDWVKVKGKLQPVRIFELICEGALPASRQSAISLFNEGFQLYHEQKFREATERFVNALSFDPHDAPSQLYIERCEDYLREPPPSNWDGVSTMTSK